MRIVAVAWAVALTFAPNDEAPPSAGGAAEIEAAEAMKRAIEPSMMHIIA